MINEVTKKIGAGIVLYQPTVPQVLKLARRLDGELARIAFFLNSPLEKKTIKSIEQNCVNCQVIFINESGNNLGLGVAYNELVRDASKAGMDELILFDQDSMPAVCLVKSLSRINTLLRLKCENPIIVGPQPINYQNKRLRSGKALRTFLDLRVSSVPFVISSGSLIDLKKALAVGPFRDDFFIDGIDIEWCYRAKEKGFTIWRSHEVLMKHELGAGTINLFGLTLTKQPEKRIYTFFRNQISMLKLSHIPFTYKLRILLGFPVRVIIYAIHSRFSKGMLKAMLQGFLDGYQQRLGPTKDF
jgi:rhamnosyltransferase